MPCEHYPYRRTGHCKNWDWGPKHTTNPDDETAQSVRGYAYRNCTDFVAWKLQKLGVPELKWRGLGNGGEWAQNAYKNGLPVSSTPKAGTAAVAPSHDHVAFVKAVHHDGTITVEEYNHDEMGDGDTWTGRPSQRGFTLYVKFGVHLLHGSSPVGHLESVSPESHGKVRLTGWAYDPDAPKAAVRIRAWVDGRPGHKGARMVDLGWATKTRNDVARVHRAAGALHGFSYTVSGVKPGKHVFRVYALNRAGGGAIRYLGGRTIHVPASRNSRGTGKGGGRSRPRAPTGLTVSGASTSGITLSWSSVGAAGYRLFLNGTHVATTTGTSYTFSGLSCGTRYTLGVQATNSGNLDSSLWSARSTVTASTGRC
jgi:surface antigen